MKKLVLSLGVFLSFSNLAYGRQIIDGFDVPVPQGAIEVISPVYEGLAPKTEQMLCTYLDFFAPEDLYITKFTGFQSLPAGHHAVLFATTKTEAPGTTKPCQGDDADLMSNMRYLAGTAGIGKGQESYLPEGVVLKAQKGSQFVIQTHWLNYTNQEVKGQAAFHIYTKQLDANDQIADFLFVTTTQFSLAAQQKSKVETECTLRKDVTIANLSAHLHEFGKHAKISLLREGRQPEVIINHGWNEHYVSFPPRLDRGISLKTGDKIRVECDFYNTTDQALTYPTEMCGLVGWAYPVDRVSICIDNVFL